MGKKNKQVNKQVVGVILLFVILSASGCSTPKKLDQTVSNIEKKPFVEHIREKIADFKSSLSQEASFSDSSEREIGNWKQYYNSEPSYNFKYPLSVSVNGQSKKTDFSLIINNLKLENTKATGTVSNEDFLILAKNIQSGTNDAFWGDSLPDAQIIGKIGEEGYREELFFDNGDCNLNFERKIVFYKEGYLVTLSLIAPADKIIKENPDFFKVGPKECEEKTIWKYERQSEFYLMLKENRLSGTAQEWYNLFDLIKESIDIQSKGEIKGVAKIKENVFNESVRWPEIDKGGDMLENISNDLSRIGENKAEDRIKEADYFVNYNKAGLLSLTIAGKLSNNDEYLSYRNYNINKDQILSIVDLIKEEKVDDLVILAGVKLKENIKNYDLKNFADRSFSREDLENFSLTNEGIRFNIGKSSPSDRFTPELYVLFSYEELKDYLKIQI